MKFFGLVKCTVPIGSLSSSIYKKYISMNFIKGGVQICEGQ